MGNFVIKIAIVTVALGALYYQFSPMQICLRGEHENLTGDKQPNTAEYCSHYGVKW